MKTRRIQLGDDKGLVISAQARNILKLHGVDEEKFVQKMLELFESCFTKNDVPFHRIYVGKSSFFDNEVPNVRIEIFDAWKKVGE